MHHLENRAKKFDNAMAYATLICRRFFNAFFVLLLLAGMAVADPPAPDANPLTHTITTNPQVNPFLNGWGKLGLLLGLSEESGIRLGGIFIPQLNWTVSGGVRPHSVFGGLLLGLNLGVDMQKALSIPGGTFGIEFLEYTGGSTNPAAGSVQQYDGLNGPSPRARQELMQLWWHQRLFDDKLIFQFGKMNAAGSFGAVLAPVAISDPKLQDIDISVLLWSPSGINPTMFGRLPIYPNTAYGAAVHFAPTKNLYASYGIFDGNAAQGKQTGVILGPRINSYKFNVGELGVTWLLGAEKKPGRFGIGGWVQTGELLTSYLTEQNGATGYYLFANQRLWYRHPDRDNSGLVGFLQFGHTSDNAAMANTYFGAGLTGVGLVPVLPNNRISIGMARSQLNDSPFAGAFFFPSVPSDSTRLRASELMLQVALQTTFVFPLPKGFWTPTAPLTAVTAYTCIPTPGERPDLPAAHMLTVRLVSMF